jgi:uncharacterized SAM-binding protein YcdF (DUF218 family)
MFILKKLLAQLFFPMPVSLGICFLGLLLLWFTTKQRTGKIVVSVGLLVLTLMSYPVISDRLLGPLESKYHPYEIKNSTENAPARSRYPVRFIVVLAGGHTSDPKLPAASQLGPSSLVRLIEGIRIYRKHPGSKLVLSGGAVFDPVPNSQVMARVAREVGVDGTDIILESTSRDTKDEARAIRPIVGNDPFILVTSASHMPRSVAMFKRLGMNPVPAPTGHRVKENQGSGPGSFFPNAGNLRKSEAAFYEYLGLAWATLRGQI